MLLAAVTLGLSACASYDHKDYPRESWFAPSTQVISADQFKKVETPLKVALVVNYTWEGRPIVQEPFEERPADWREPVSYTHLYRQTASFCLDSTR